MMHKKDKKGHTPKNNKLSPNDLLNEPIDVIRQGSQYNDHCQAAPLNDIFFEEKSNPLSSRGN